MIGAVTGPGIYSSRVQWNPYANVRGNTAANAENPDLIAQKAAKPETPVQPVDAAAPVTSEASGNLNTELSVRNSADVTAMAVRGRISPAEAQEAAPLPGTQEAEAQEAMGEEQAEGQTLPGVTGEEEAQAQAVGAQEEQVEETPQAFGQETENGLEAQQAERQAKLEERAQAEREAQEQRDAYLESVEQTQQKREERIEALRAEQSQEGGEAEEAVNRAGTGEEEAQEGQKAEEEPGSLELDYAAALLQNYQMTNLLRDQISARMNGGDPEPFNAALDALSQNGRERLRFATESGRESSRAQAQQAYQRMMNNSVLPGVVA